MQSSRDEARINSARILSILLRFVEEEIFIKHIKEILADVENKVAVQVTFIHFITIFPFIIIFPF